LQFHEAALSLRSERQQVLASNIANADTPNYKARDIDFNKALQGALSRSSQPVSQAPGVLVKTGAAAGAGPLLYRTAQPGNVDGNTVDMDVERNQFTDNALRYEVGLTLIGAQIRSMLNAIQGQ